MNARLRSGIAIPQIDDLAIETGRLKLRGWREADIAPNTVPGKRTRSTCSVTWPISG